LAAMAASTKYILAAVAASKKIEYKNVENFLYSIFLKKPQNLNGRGLRKFIFRFLSSVISSRIILPLEIF